MKFKLGFTLAEVLIVLNIVGTVAAMTLPTLISEVREVQCISGLQVAYSILNQAFNSVVSEKGSGVDNWECWSADDIYNLFKVRLNVKKDCGRNSGCWTQGLIQNFTNIGTNSNYVKLELTNGMQLSFDSYFPLFNKQYAGTSNFTTTIIVDVNGKKLPNIIGRDIFGFALKKDSIVPLGCDSDSCQSGGSMGCTCRILKNKKWVE